MRPGLIAFTWTPSRMPISATAFVNERQAPFTEPPIVNSAPGVRPPAPMMFRTEPRSAGVAGVSRDDRCYAPGGFDFPRNLGQIAFGPSGEDKRGAILREAHGDRAANAPARSGHNRDLAFQRFLVRHPVCSC